MKKIFGNIPIYWINLDSSLDRLEHMGKQLIGTNNYRISAIDGLNEKTFNEKYQIINANPLFSSGFTAVISSHMKAIKLASINNLDYVIIVEDKCNFEYVDNCKHSIEDIIKMINKQDLSWEIILLCPVLDDYQDYINNGLKIYKKTFNLTGCNYLINKKGINKILNLIPTDGVQLFDYSNVTKAVDPERILFDYLNSYYINYPLFYVYSKKTTFHSYYKGQDKSFTLAILEKHRKDVMNFFDKYNIEFKSMAVTCMLGPGMTFLKVQR
ncbi:MAG: glycosyltransferase family 25 [Hyperionvirus sp.]|uniref:Glycosyltransferase family 25 n=1 Tax=Hyperionvirus sp. TaxID=2487770 RepID=A0A3G5AAE5_9VIRU|nr:MAG: glycosyltransferase family 25 [Hyperionvirus sp.]